MAVLGVILDQLVAAYASAGVGGEMPKGRAARRLVVSNHNGTHQGAAPHREVIGECRKIESLASELAGDFKAEDGGEFAIRFVRTERKRHRHSNPNYHQLQAGG